jgi:DNA-directed RNA polymerase subunit RPC12/RpoP
MEYRCKECGQPVEVAPNQEITRRCKHEGAAIVAPMEAKCQGAGGIK